MFRVFLVCSALMLRTGMAEARPPSPPKVPDGEISEFIQKNGGQCGRRDGFDGPVVSVHLENAKDVDSILARLYTLKHLTKLGFCVRNATNTGFKSIPDCKGLTELTLDFTLDFFELKKKGELQSNLKAARELNKQKAWELTKQILMLPNLAKLHLVGVTDEEVAILGESVRKIKALSIDSLNVSDRSFLTISEMTELTSLVINNPTEKFTAEGFARLASCKALLQLSLTGTKVSDEEVKEIVKLKNLTKLDLSGTAVTDRGISNLAEMKALTSLDLSSTRLTDVGLQDLAAIKDLTFLNVSKTKVTAAWVKRLQKELPRCSILWSEPSR